MQTCALVAASEFNARHFTACHETGCFGCVVAVDGGLAHLESAGFVPDFILGDFDSLGHVPVGSNVEVYPVHKDKSDLELALDYVKIHQFDRVAIYGALGGRLDHSLANLQICACFAEEGMDITLIGLESAVHILVGPAVYRLPVVPAGIVSVFSATDESRGVTELGLEYPLENARLTNRTSLGLSNELVGEPASVSVEHGTVYVFHPLGL